MASNKMLYTIEGKKLGLGEIVAECERLAEVNKDWKRYFVGRETIRGRLRCGVRTWDGLTSKALSHQERVQNHRWRGKKAAEGRQASDGLYEPEEYVGPDEAVDKYG